jgi:hypothetical protein
MVVQAYETAPVVAEVADPAGPTADMLAASLNPVDIAAAAAESVPAAGAAPGARAGRGGPAGGRDAGALLRARAALRCLRRAGAAGRSGDRAAARRAGPVPGRRARYLRVAAWAALAGTAALRPGESVLVLGGNGRVGRIAVQAARLLGARRVTAVVQHEAARQAPLWLGAGTVVTSQDLPTLTERLLETDQRGYDVILDTLWGPVIPVAADAAAPGARVVHLGNSGGALATLAGPALRKNQVSILTYSIFTLPARERSDAFARPTAHAAAGELTVDYRETGLETLPAISDDVAAGRAHTKIIVQTGPGNPRMTAPARTGGRQETTGPSPGFRTGQPSPERSGRLAGTTRTCPPGQVTVSSPPMRHSRWRHPPAAAVCEPTHRKEEIMTTTVSLSFAALTIDSADPAALADFWGKALGRPVSPGAVAGDTAVDVTAPDSGPRMVLHNPPEPKTAKNSIHPVLMTDHHDEETERLTALGARPLNEIKLPAVRLGEDLYLVRQTTFADPEGNEFDLVTWQQQPE